MLLALVLVLGVGGAAGMIAFGIFLYSPAPPPANGFPAFLGLLAACITLLLALESIFLLRFANSLGTLTHQAWMVGVAGAALTTAVAALLTVGYFIGYRVDGGLWGCVLFMVSLTCLSGALGRSKDAGATIAPPELASHPAPFRDEAIITPLSPLLVDNVVGNDTLNDGGPAARGEPFAADVTPLPPHTMYCCSSWLPRGPPHSWPHPSRFLCIAHIAHTTVWIVVIIFLTLMLGGCFTQAIGFRRYPPRGRFYDLTVESGAMQRIHAWCSGPTASSTQPTVWIEVGGGGHSSSDLYGLQWALNDAGYRVCTYDPPGTAWSGYVTTRIPAPVTCALMDAMGEDGPFVMLGTMDDGPARIYEFALQRPEKVHALVPMQYGPPEFMTLAAYRGWDASTAASVAVTTLTSRLALCDVIRGLAVQWGLMPLFVPLDANYTLAATQGEKLFLNLYTEKQWTTQCFYLYEQISNPHTLLLSPDIWTRNRTLAPSIPVFALENAPPIESQCAAAGFPLNSDDCNLLNFTTVAGHQFMLNMTTMTPGSMLLAYPGGPKDLLGTGETVMWVVGVVIAAAAAL